MTDIFPQIQMFIDIVEFKQNESFFINKFSELPNIAISMMK